MVETFTAAGCGGRARQAVGIGLFSVGAIVASAAFGAMLAAAGGLLPARWAVVSAAGICAAAALREMGILRLPLPQVRRQVPERWRRERPLAVWSFGYGVLLGAGAGTYQPVATFWVVCAAAVALAKPAAAAVCLGCFGLGRAVMIAGPADPLRRLAAAHRFVRPANAVVLAALALLLMPAAAQAAGPSGQSDPSVSRGAIASTDLRDGASAVVVRSPGRPPTTFPGGRMPALSGDVLAYVDDDGIRVVLWKSHREVARIRGAVRTPALSGPRLAYVQSLGARERLLVRSLSTGRVRVIASAGPGVDLGRPSLSGQLLAWHETAGDRNQILLRALNGRRTRVMVSAPRRLLTVNPAVIPGWFAWVESLAERSNVYVRRLPNGAPRRVASTLGPRYHFWNIALERGRVHVTRWALNANTAGILRYRFR